MKKALLLLVSFLAITSTAHALRALPTDDIPDDNATIYCPQLSQTLKRGARDITTNPTGQVSELQNFLADYFELNERDVITGFFGRTTQWHVMNFQRQHGLPAYGIAGTLTRMKIAEVCRTRTTPVPVCNNYPKLYCLPNQRLEETEPDARGCPRVARCVDVVNIEQPNVSITTPRTSYITGEPILVTTKATRTVNNDYGAATPAEGYKVLVTVSYPEGALITNFNPAYNQNNGYWEGNYVPSYNGGTHVIRTELYCTNKSLPCGKYIGVTTDQVIASAKTAVTITEASSIPTCSITTDRSSYQLNDIITFSWVSARATYAQFLPDTSGKDNLQVPGDKLPAQGSQQIRATVYGNPYVTLKVVGPEGQSALCQKVVPVLQQTDTVFSVTAPSPSETLYTGQMKDIVWTRPSGAGSMVNIHLHGEVAMNQSNVAVPVVETVIFNTPNTGMFRWKIPEEYGLGWKNNTFSVSVEDVATKKQTHSMPFTIRSSGQARDIIVSEPRFGGRYAPGERVRIAWNHIRSNALRLTLLKKSDPGYGRFFFADGLPWEGQSWAVPSDIPAGDDYYIRIAETPNNTSGQLGAQRVGYSDTFSIQGVVSGNVRVTSPNGGERWERGTLHSITWTPYSYNPDVNPSRSMDAFLEKRNYDGTFTTLGSVIPSGKASIHWMAGFRNDGYQEGTVEPGDNFFIRVVNKLTGASDRSDAAFSIVPTAITLTVNNSEGPVTVSNGQTVNVAWAVTPRLTSCYISGTFNGGYPTYVSNNGSQSVQVDTNGVGPTTFINLSCTQAPVADGVYDPNPLDTTTISGKSVVSKMVSLIVQGTPQVAPAVAVTSPNGGEVFDIHKAVTVRWTHKGFKSYSVALYRNDQWFAWIGRDFAGVNVGDLYSVDFIPSALGATVGDGYKIYITGQRLDGQGYIDDKSDAAFSFSTQSSGGGLSPWGQKLMGAKANLPEGRFAVRYFNRGTFGTVPPPAAIADEPYFNYIAWQSPWGGQAGSGVNDSKIAAYWGMRSTYGGATETYDFSNPQWDTARLYIDGVLVHTYGANGGSPQYSHMMTAGEHTVEVEYESNWHAGTFAMRKGIPVSPGYGAESGVAQFLQAREDVYGKVTYYGASVYESSDNTTGTISVQMPPLNGPTVLVLSSYDPITWSILGGANENLKGVVVYSFAGGSAVRGVLGSLPQYFVRNVYVGTGSGETTAATLGAKIGKTLNGFATGYATSALTITPITAQGTSSGGSAGGVSGSTINPYDLLWSFTPLRIFGN